jgi:hypothetical protein
VEALVLLVHRRKEMLGWLDDCLFVDDRHLAVFHALAAEADVAAALAALRDRDPGSADILARVAVSDSDAEPDDVGARLIEEAASRVLRDLQAAARVAAEPLDVNEPIRDVKLGMERLRDRSTRVEAAALLLALLAARTQE